jgi:hypothetical protein
LSFQQDQALVPRAKRKETAKRRFAENCKRCDWRQQIIKRASLKTVGKRVMMLWIKHRSQEKKSCQDFSSRSSPLQWL